MIAVVYAHKRRYTHKDLRYVCIWLGLILSAVTVAQKTVYG